MIYLLFTFCTAGLLWVLLENYGLLPVIPAICVFVLGAFVLFHKPAHKGS